MNQPESVGTLLAAIANLISDGLRILSFSDKRQWGPDEHEQARALQEVLDEAKKDFQELSPLVNGQFHYEHDRKHDSIEELKALCNTFQQHVQILRDWARSGGPINPTWVRETRSLQRMLHRAQCRVARRIHASEQETSSRCLGAFLVHRVQRSKPNTRVGVTGGEDQVSNLEELIACKRVGTFERFGEHDIAFICDFCDGHMVWEDLDSMPTTRMVLPLETDATSVLSPESTSQSLSWQASGFARTTPQEKQIVFAPLVIGSHIAPLPHDWQARLLCPICEEIGEQPQDQHDDGDPYRPTEEFDDVVALQEHLEWEHPLNTVASEAPVSGSSTNNCMVM